MKSTLYKKQDMRPGLLIVRGQHPDAQVYTVQGQPENNQIYLVWFEGSRKCGQWSDYSGCYKPTVEQIEYSINANGRLAGIKDVYAELGEATFFKTAIV
jgi:hypothetical protein